MRIEKVLGVARRRAGLTQRELGRLAGVPQSTIGRIESGASDPRASTLSRLLRFCDGELELVPRLGVGVDRSLIHSQLSLTPEERVRNGVAAARAVASWRGALRPNRRKERVAPNAAPLDPPAAIRVLVDAHVDFVVIGGVAGLAHGSPLIAFELEICCARPRANLERLVVVLKKLHATLRGVPKDLRYQLDAKTLAMGDTFTFDTDAGSLDCLGTPAGVAGYEELKRGAATMELGGVHALVTSLDDLIRMKRASGRAKDRVELENLGALREELERE